MSSRRPKHGRVLSGKPDTPSNFLKRYNWSFFLPIIGLCLFGLLMVYDASVAVSVARYGHDSYFFDQQALNFVIGLIFLIALSLVDYHVWLRLSPYILLGATISLMLVFVPGLGVEMGGATSWLRISPLPQFQPSYPLIIALVLYLSRWLTSPKFDMQSLQHGLLPYAMLVGFFSFIVAVPQGDLGTAMMLATTCLLLYFLAGAPFSHIGILLSAAVAAGIAMVISTPYRLRRVATFLQDGSGDAQAADWQVNQLLIALGAGGITGQGLGNSRQKYDWLPVVESDSIFAIIGEELGYLGTTIVISVYFYLIWQGFQIAAAAPDPEGRLLAIGLVSFLSIQTLVNLLAAVSVIPLTGVPLPFISSGGTSLVVLMAALGIVLNISLRSPQSGNQKA